VFAACQVVYSHVQTLLGGVVCLRYRCNNARGPAANCLGQSGQVSSAVCAEGCSPEKTHTHARTHARTCTRVSLKFAIRVLGDNFLCTSLVPLHRDRRARRAVVYKSSGLHAPAAARARECHHRRLGCFGAIPAVCTVVKLSAPYWINNVHVATNVAWNPSCSRRCNHTVKLHYGMFNSVSDVHSFATFSCWLLDINLLGLVP